MPGCFAAGEKNFVYQPNRKLLGSQSQSGCLGEWKNCFQPAGIARCFINPIAQPVY